MDYEQICICLEKFPWIDDATIQPYHEKRLKDHVQHCLDSIKDMIEEHSGVGASHCQFISLYMNIIIIFICMYIAFYAEVFFKSACDTDDTRKTPSRPVLIAGYVEIYNCLAKYEWVDKDTRTFYQDKIEGKKNKKSFKSLTQIHVVTKDIILLLLQG